MTAKTTSMFSPILSSLHQLGGGNPIVTVQSSQKVMGEDMLARAMAKAISELPPPVVSVEEINRMQNNVRVWEGMRMQ